MSRQTKIKKFLSNQNIKCKNENIFDDRYLKLISEYVFIEPSPAPIKYILSELGYIQNILRLPLTTISEESQVRLAPLVEKYRK